MNNNKKSLKELIIWQKGQKIFEMVCEDVAKWPKTPASTTIAYQVTDSSGSISSTIAEGYGRGGPKEFEQFLRYSRGSCAETDNWLYKAQRLHLISQHRYEHYLKIFDEEYKMIGSFINKLRRQSKR